MIDWPSRLIDELARRRVVLFLGAGVSMNSINASGQRPPSWKEFLREGIQKCEKPTQHILSLMKASDFLTACEVIKKKLKDKWLSLLDEQFVKPGFETATIHQHLFSLDQKVVATVNFDKIYDTYAQSVSNNTVRVVAYTDAELASYLRGDHRVVIKVHGTIDKPGDMIFTRAEYARARHSHASFFSVLDALALTHTFLFVGCGFTDPTTQLLLEKQTYLFRSEVPHYMTMARGSVHAETAAAIEENLGIRLIYYSRENGHLELTESLGLLISSVESARSEMAKTKLW